MTANVDKNSVRSDRTAKRERGVIENKEFSAFASRILKAYARRVAQGDVEALTDLLAFAKDVDAAIGDAVTGLREFGYTWSEIGSRAGVTKSTAQERWGTRRPEPRTDKDPSAHVVCTVQLSLFHEQAGGEL